LRPRATLAAWACAAALVSAASVAHAQMGLIVSGGPVLETTDARPGGSIDGRLTFRVGLPAALIFGGGVIFEFQTIGSYTSIHLQPTSTLAPSAASSWLDVGRVMWGLRAGVNSVAGQWFLFLGGGPAFGSDGFGSSLTAGASWDWRLSWASIGLHTTFNALWVDAGTLTWVEIGPHVQARWALW
jgi:hypothetical protein